MPDPILPITSLVSDVMTLGGLVSPGPPDARVRITNIQTPRKLDERDGYGASGATLVYNGNKLASFDAVFEMWGELGDVEGLPFFALCDRAPSGVFPVALSVWHPVLARAGITTVMVRDGGGWEEDEDGLYSRRVKFIEWRKPLPALVAPQAAIPTAPDPAAATLNPVQLQTVNALNAANVMIGQLATPSGG